MQHFDSSSDRTFFKVCSQEKSFSIDLLRHVKIVIPILKNCLVNHCIFKGHFLCLEFKTVEKIRCPRKRSFKAAREESYVQSAYLGEKIEGRRSETLYSSRCGCKFGKSKTDEDFTQHKHDKYSLQTKTQKLAEKYFGKACEISGKFVARVIVLRFLLVNKKWS